MLTGTKPFNYKEEKENFQKIQKGDYVMPNHLSNNSKSIISKLLNIDVND